MLGLLIDASRNPAVLGLIDGKKILKIIELSPSKKLSSLLFPVLENFCPLEYLNYIAVGIGPGSFMGIRTAATIGKTVSFAKNLPLIEFFSPLAFIPDKVEGSFVIFNDAKMDRYYLLNGRIKNSTLIEFSTPIIIPTEDLSRYLNNKDFIIGPGHLDPKPNLTFVANLCKNRYIENDFAGSSNLELSYLT